MQPSTIATNAPERPVARLLRLASTARLFRSADGCPSAQVDAGTRCETYPIKSPAFRDWRRPSTAPQLEESPVGYVLLEYARYMYDWAGTATDLLCKLSACAGKRVVASPRWPKSPVWLARELRRAAPYSASAASRSNSTKTGIAASLSSRHQAAPKNDRLRTQAPRLQRIAPRTPSTSANKKLLSPANPNPTETAKAQVSRDTKPISRKKYRHNTQVSVL
jgi:hypothetical protein